MTDEEKRQKQRERSNAHYRANKKVYIEAARKWKKANPEIVRASNAAYRNRHKDACNSYNIAWAKAHPENARAIGAKWAAANPDKIRSMNANRRATKRGAEGRHTAEEIKKLLARQKCHCAACKKSIEAGYHKDRIVPLARGGSNYIRNIQLLCPKCNTKKGAKHPVKFMQEMGYLL